MRHLFSRMGPKGPAASDAVTAVAGVVGSVAAVGGVIYMWKSGPSDYPPNRLSKTVQGLPNWIKAGCGNAEYYCPEKNAIFPGDNCPEIMPDISKHNNIMTDVLNKNPEIYEKLKHRQTQSGVTFAKCAKTGFDNPGHPMVKTCGLVAGDEESYEVFKEIFDTVIDLRHGGYKPDQRHKTDMDVTKLSGTKIDPTCDSEGNCKYVLTTRCRTGRSVRGMRLPPACDFEERRELERVMVKGLKKMSGELQGQYFPLHGSKSYGSSMGRDKEEELRSKGNLFQEPDSTLLLSSGCGRHWPDARGIFHNTEKNFFVWINEEDHMRIISMQKGDDIKAIFRRFQNATSTIQKTLKGEGYDFMHNDHLGYILTCPSNLGTGLRAGAMVKARGTSGVDSQSTGGTWDISNADRLGKSEVVLVNTFIEGVAKCIRWEMALEKGETIDADVRKYL